MRATTGQILGKAHRLCEWLRKSDVELLPGYAATPMAWAVESAGKWHVGNVLDLPAPKDRESLDSFPLRLPTKEMLVEFDNEMRMADGRIAKMTGFLLCYEHREEAIEFLAFGQCDGRFFFDGGGALFIDDGKRKFAAFDDFEHSKSMVGELHRLSYILEQTLLALHCTNVRSVDNPPPAALNKKRQKASKPPLFTYKTLHILSGERGAAHDPRADDAEAKRSPRLHFRRGHVRRISGGRITWVQQCMVGNGRLGVIEKTYALEAR